MSLGRGSQVFFPNPEENQSEKTTQKESILCYDLEAMEQMKQNMRRYVKTSETEPQPQSRNIRSRRAGSATSGDRHPIDNRGVPYFPVVSVSSSKPCWTNVSNSSSLASSVCVDSSCVSVCFMLPRYHILLISAPVDCVIHAERKFGCRPCRY